MNFLKKHRIWSRFIGITLSIAILIACVPLLGNNTDVAAEEVGLPNLVSGGDFESGTTLPTQFETVTGYEEKFNGYYTIQSTDKPTGFTGNNLKLTWNKNDFSTYTFFTIQVPVESGSTYDVSYNITTTDTTGLVKLRYSYGTSKWNGSNWGGYGTVVRDSKGVSTLGGTVSHKVTATADTLWLLVGVKDERTTATDDISVYFDNITVTPAVNLILNGNFESDLTSWSKGDETNLTVGTATELGITDNSTGKVLKITGNSSTWPGIWQQNIAVEPNTTYLISFDYYLNGWFGGQYKYGPNMTDSNLTKPAIYWYAADNANLVRDKWSTFTKEVTTAANQTTFAFAIAGSGGGIFVDNIKLQKAVTVTATAQEGGAISGLPTGKIYTGDKLSLTATPDGGYEFDGWYAGSEKITDELVYSFIAYKDIALTAKFKTVNYELIQNGSFETGDYSGWSTSYASNFSVVNAADEAAGTKVDGDKILKLTNSGAEGWYTLSQKPTIEANTDYVFSFRYYRVNDGTTSRVNYPAVQAGYADNNWSGYLQQWLNNANKGQWVTFSKTFNSGNHTLFNLSIAAFNGTSYVDNVSLKKVVKVTTTAEGGTISGIPTTVLQGDKLTVTAVPDAGYEFSGWYKNGTRVADTASYTFYAAADTALEAKFESTNNLIADGSFEGTTLHANWNNSYNRGSITTDEKSDGAQSLFIEKQSGYGNLYYWPINVEANTKYRITMKVKIPTGAEIPIIKVLDNAGSGNSILDQKNADGNTWLNARNNNIVAGCDWQEAWFTFNSGDKTQVSMLFTGGANAAAYIDDISIIKYYNINATAESGGKITGLSQNWAYVDTPISLTATPEAGFTFDGWYENSVKLSSDATLKFNATADRTIVAKFAALDNYIVDGGFELDTLYSGWSLSNPADNRFVNTTDEFYEGEQSLHINKTTLNYPYAHYPITVKKNTNYMIKMMVKIPSGASAPLLQAIGDVSGHILDGRDMTNNNFFINGGTNENVGNGWFVQTATFNSGENTQVKISLTGNSKAEAYIDNLIVGEAFTATITAGENGSVPKTEVMGLKNTLGAITATPDEDYMVEGWYINGQKVSEEKTYNHLFTEDVQLEVRFTLSDLPVMTKFDLNKLWCAEADNMLSDSSFENGTGAWNTASFIKSDVLDVVELDGEKVLYFNPDGTGRQVVYFPVTLEGNTEYMFSANVKGKYYSATNRMDMSFGIMTDYGEYITLKNANMGGYRDETPNVTFTKSITPPSWDNNWHRRGITFKTIAPVTVWIAVSGNLSEAYLDDFMLCEVNKSTAQPVEENLATRTNISVSESAMGCADSDNLVENYNFSSGSVGWEDGYGWNGLYSGTYIGNSGNNNNSLFMRSTTGYADNHYYIQWIDVKPNTEYTFSLASAATSFDANYGLLVEGAKRYSKLISWTAESNSEWIYNAFSFNSNDNTRVGIFVMDGGRVTALDDIRLFETAKATALENKLTGKADLPDEYIPPVEEGDGSVESDVESVQNTSDDDTDDTQKTVKKTRKKKVVKVMKNPTDGENYTLWWILGGIGAALLIAAITVFIIILIKKKRKKAE